MPERSEEGVPAARDPGFRAAGASGGAQPDTGIALQPHPLLVERLPWWRAFFPDAAAPGADPATPLLPPGPPATAGALRCAPSFWHPPSFGQRFRPVALIVAGADPGGGDPLARALATGAARPADAASLAALMVEARVGGRPGLPDPGPAGLGLPKGEAVVVIDPCDPARAAAAGRLLLEAGWLAGKQSRSLLIIASPDAPLGAAPVLTTTPATRRIEGRLAPWTLVELADSLFGIEEATGLLALAAGTRFTGTLPGGAPPDDQALPRLFAATRWADPFREIPATPEAGLRQLADWRVTAVENRQVAACLNMQFWKRDRMAALFGRPDGTVPGFHRRPGPAIAAAAAAGGAIAVWATRMPPGLPAAAAAAGARLLYVEDGFIRSAGLGAGFLPGASYALDPIGPYYDPSIVSGLETLLSETCFDEMLLRRARALRSAIVRHGISKYNLDRNDRASQPMPGLPQRGGRRLILVPGQVENDASVRRGGGAVQDNLSLLRAVRDSVGEACIIYKPHPDVTAGYRPGRIAARDLAGLADLVLPDAPITRLVAAVDEVHTLTSQAGFEALLREKPVTTYGQPFYAGWQLTTDRHPLPRRRRRLSLDELVAGCLIAYPRYIDPVTELPCPAELVLDRLADPGANPGAWRSGRAARLRRWQGGAVAAIARLLRRR